MSTTNGELEVITDQCNPVLLVADIFFSTRIFCISDEVVRLHTCSEGGMGEVGGARMANHGGSLWF